MSSSQSAFAALFGDLNGGSENPEPVSSLAGGEGEVAEIEAGRLHEGKKCPKGSVKDHRKGMEGHCRRTGRYSKSKEHRPSKRSVKRSYTKTHGKGHTSARRGRANFAREYRLMKMGHYGTGVRKEFFPSSHKKSSHKKSAKKSSMKKLEKLQRGAGVVREEAAKIEAKLSKQARALRQLA